MVTQLHIERPYTASDLAEIEDDRNRYEIIGGELIVSPSPIWTHQDISMRLATILFTWLEKSNLGKVFAAPLDVHLSEYDVVQPDILILLNENLHLLENFVMGSPDLVVEIVSPSSSSIDRIRKSAIYATAGVPEYWIVDPTRNAIVVFTLKDRRYEPLTTMDDFVHSKVVPGLVVDPKDVFTEVESSR